MQDIEIKQVLVYRRDLKMRKGKIAAQCAHASMAVFFNRGSILRKDHPGLRTSFHPTPLMMIGLTDDMATWAEGLFGKIVLSVENEEDLLRIHELAKEAGIPTALITDAGRTEFKGVPTNTTVAIGPARNEDIDKITGPDGAVTTKLA